MSTQYSLEFFFSYQSSSALDQRCKFAPRFSPRAKGGRIQANFFAFAPRAREAVRFAPFSPSDVRIFSKRKFSPRFRRALVKLSLCFFADFRRAFAGYFFAELSPRFAQFDGAFFADGDFTESEKKANQLFKSKNISGSKATGTRIRNLTRGLHRLLRTDILTLLILTLLILTHFENYSTHAHSRSFLSELTNLY